MIKDTKKLLMKYMEVTGSRQQWIAEQIGVSRSCINRYLSDKTDYIPSNKTLTKINNVILHSIDELNSMDIEINNN